MKHIISKKKVFVAIAVVLIATVLTALLCHSARMNYDTHYENYFSKDSQSFSYKKYMYDNGFTDVHLVWVRDQDVNYNKMDTSFIGHSKDDLWEIGINGGYISIKCNIPNKEDSYVIHQEIDRANDGGFVQLNGDGDYFVAIRSLLDAFDVIVRNIIIDPHNTDIMRDYNDAYKFEKKTYTW